MKLLIMQFSTTTCHFISLPSKYSPQHPVLKHPQSIFILTRNYLLVALCLPNMNLALKLLQSNVNLIVTAGRRSVKRVLVKSRTDAAVKSARCAARVFTSVLATENSGLTKLGSQDLPKISSQEIISDWVRPPPPHILITMNRHFK
jgi:hypothetical protein